MTRFNGRLDETEITAKRRSFTVRGVDGERARPTNVAPFTFLAAECGRPCPVRVQCAVHVYGKMPPVLVELEKLLVQCLGVDAIPHYESMKLEK
jgi:hypothetical protein